MKCGIETRDHSDGIRRPAAVASTRGGRKTDHPVAMPAGIMSDTSNSRGKRRAAAIRLRRKTAISTPSIISEPCVRVRGEGTEQLCNLYSRTPKRDAVAQFFRVSHNRSIAFEAVNAIFPRHVALVVAAHRQEVADEAFRASSTDNSARECSGIPGE